MYTASEPEIRRVVREDILRVLGEKKGKSSLQSIRGGTGASSFLVAEALKRLQENELVQVEKMSVALTSKGEEKWPPD